MKKSILTGCKWAATHIFLCVLLSGCGVLHKVERPIAHGGIAQTIFVYSKHSEWFIDYQALTEFKKRYHENAIDLLESHLLDHHEPGLKSDDRFLSAIKVSAPYLLNESSIEELFSRELARFLFQDDYNCTSPIMFDYFNQRYGSVQKKSRCSKAVPFLTTDTLSRPEIVFINPESVSEVHLLYAGSAENYVSRFGHVFLRLIVCPTTNSTPIECDENLREHLVLGFRAYIDDSRISILKGLFGGYEAFLFSKTFMDVYGEYAIKEFRYLKSLPLKIPKEQTHNLVRQLSQVHWMFKADYKFLTKNCATLLQNLLTETVPELNLGETFLRRKRRTNHPL